MSLLRMSITRSSRRRCCRRRSRVTVRGGAGEEEAEGVDFYD